MSGRRKHPFPIVDVDAHVYEPEAIWERHVPREYQAVARSAFFHALDGQGNAVTVLNGSAARELNRTKIVRQAIWRPGMTLEQIGRLDPNVFHPLNPGAAEPEARVADLDALGIDQQVIFPTLFAEYFPLVENPEAALVLARAYNDWIFDFCAVAPIVYIRSRSCRSAVSSSPAASSSASPPGASRRSSCARCSIADRSPPSAACLDSSSGSRTIPSRA